MKITLIIEDICFMKALENIIIHFFSEKEEEVSIFCLDSAALLEPQNNMVPSDCYLFDIKADNLLLAEKVRILYRNANIAFFLPYEKYTVQNLQTESYHYILRDSYPTTLSNYLESIYRKENYYSFINPSNQLQISIHDIFYLTKEKKYSLFHCKNGVIYKERNSLRNIAFHFPDHLFVMICKGIIVNLEHIKQLAKPDVIMTDGTVLPVSRRAWKMVNEKLEEHWRTTKPKK